MSDKIEKIMEKVKKATTQFVQTPTLCYLPFIHMEADAKGWLKPCCMAEGPATDENGDPYDINKGATITEAFNSNYMQKLRQDFLDGKKPEVCNRCWKEEDSGLESKRINWAHYFAYSHHHLHDVFRRQITEKDIAYLDLKLGTICNLKCRICGSMSSSKWAQEEIDIDRIFHGIDKDSKDSTQAYFYLKQGEWPRKSPKFWEDLEKILPNVKHLEFTGGEPWMIKEHFKVLQTLIDKGHAKDINLHYNTNGTQLPKHEFHNVLPHFNKCKISFSIDDMYDRFEYQRYGAKWNEVNSNIRYICENKGKIETEVCTTINLFNFHNLTDLADWIYSLEGLDSWYLNLMHSPANYNIFSHKTEVKEIITNKLNSYDWEKLSPKGRGFKITNDVTSMLTYMNTQSFKDSAEFPNIISHEQVLAHINKNIFKVDSLRNKTLNDVDPVLSDYLGYNFEELKTIIKRFDSE